MEALKNTGVILLAVFAVLFCALIPTVIFAVILIFKMGLTLTSILIIGSIAYISVYFTLRIFKPEVLIYTKTPRTRLFYQTLFILLGMMVIIGLVGYYAPHLLPKGAAPTDLLGRVVFVIMAVILAPLMEEAFFRGFLHKLTCEAYGKWVGITLCAILFGLAHGLNPIKFAQTFIMGLCFGRLREESQSLYPSLLLHFVNNAIAILILMLSWTLT